MSYVYEHEFIVIQRVCVKSNSQDPGMDKTWLEQGLDRHDSSDRYEHMVSGVRFVRTKEINRPPEEE
jgi:hypothetical protein